MEKFSQVPIYYLPAGPPAVFSVFFVLSDEAASDVCVAQCSSYLFAQGSTEPFVVDDVIVMQTECLLSS